MSLIPSTPTLVLVPDAFRDTVLAASEGNILALRDSVAGLARRQILDQEIRMQIKELGWPDDFAGWYADQVILHGPFLTLEVPKVTAAAADWQEHREIVKTQATLAHRSMYLAIAVFLFSVVELANVGPNHNLSNRALCGLTGSIAVMFYYCLDRFKGRYR